MPQPSRKEQHPDHEATPEVVDAIRHVGPTLEAEGTFLPSGELPENRIENERLTDAADIRAVAEDEYDRKADAMGAEPLQTRLPGDTSSDPHTDLDSDLNPELNSENRSTLRRSSHKGHAA
ncbi:MAG TPA: hypothetical protein VHZ09_11375 [Acidobacteriaceae bacterium]|jgi:hypothetical protein|nr:hypothetical protein [Acidobacteriaceae bacterium]